MHCEPPVWFAAAAIVTAYRGLEQVQPCASVDERKLAFEELAVLTLEMILLAVGDSSLETIGAAEYGLNELFVPIGYGRAQFAIDNDVDYIAASFMQRAADVEAILGSGADVRSLQRALERLEGEAAEHARRVASDGKPCRVTYDTRAGEDDLWGLAMGCNGVVEILLELLELIELARLGIKGLERRLEFDESLVCLEDGAIETGNGVLGLADTPGRVLAVGVDLHRAVEHRRDLEAAGLRLSGVSPDDRLVEMVEIPAHPFFIASQFHPECKSRPNHPHPLFEGFMRAALEHKRGDRQSTLVMSESDAEVPADRPA